MKQSKFNEYRALGITELKDEIAKKREQVYQLREKKVVEQLANPFEYRTLKREVAQLATLVREKEIVQARGVGGGAESRSTTR